MICRPWWKHLGYYREKNLEGCEILVKICNKCERSLDLSDYYKDKTKKDGLSTCCKDCRKQWKRDNKEKIASYNREYGQEHKEEAKIRKRKNRNNRVEHYRQLHRNWVARNPEKNKENKRKDYEKFKNAYIQRARLRRVLMESLRADLTYEQWVNTLFYFGQKCAYCGKDGEMHQEHIIPVSKSGEYTKDNIIPACPKCNLSKNNKDLEEWYPVQSFYCPDRLQFIQNFVNEFANQR